MASSPPLEGMDMYDELVFSEGMWMKQGVKDPANPPGKTNLLGGMAESPEADSGAHKSSHKDPSNTHRGGDPPRPRHRHHRAAASTRVSEDKNKDRVPSSSSSSSSSSRPQLERFSRKSDVPYQVLRNIGEKDPVERHIHALGGDKTPSPPKKRGSLRQKKVQDGGGDPPKPNVAMSNRVTLSRNPKNVSRISISDLSSHKTNVYECLKDEDDGEEDNVNHQETRKIQAPMLGGGEDDPSRRGPLEFFTNMFKRRRDHEPHDDPRPPDITLQEPENLSETWTKEQMVVARSSDVDATSSSEPVLGGSDTMPSLESMTSSCENLIGGSAIMHHTPVKSRDIGVDMEAIRLSRQDNPYLQKVAGSQTTLNEDEDTGDCVTNNQPEDLAQLVTQSGVQQEPALSLSEVHEHLIRSPPPTSLPKSITKNMFVFPLSKASDDGSLGSQASTSVPCRTHSLNPLVTRGHEDVLDQHLRQILNTQRQLVVSKGNRGGDSGGMTCSSVPGSPAHGRSLARRSPHARTLSEEAALVQPVGAHTMGGSSAVAGPDGAIDKGPANMGARPTYIGRGPTSIVGGAVNRGGVTSNTATSLPTKSGIGSPPNQTSTNTTSHSSMSGLAPLQPPGRRQHTPTDLLLNPANPPTNLAHPAVINPAHLPVNPAYLPTANSGTATPPILKPINTKNRKSPGMKSEGGLATTSSSLSLPIRYPHQPASSSALIDTT